MTTQTIVAIRGTKAARYAMCTIRPDGSIWTPSGPVLDGQAGTDAATVAAAIKARDWAAIPAAAYAKLGTMPSGLRVLTAEQYDSEAAAAHRAAMTPGEAEYAATVAPLMAKADRAEARKDHDYAAYVYAMQAASAAYAAWAAQYPRDAALRQAEDWTLAAHDVKAAAGRKAAAAIRAGQDYQQALAAMEAEWSAYCDAHAWD